MIFFWGDEKTRKRNMEAYRVYIASGGGEGGGGGGGGKIIHPPTHPPTHPSTQSLTPLLMHSTVGGAGRRSSGGGRASFPPNQQEDPFTHPPTHPPFPYTQLSRTRRRKKKLRRRTSLLPTHPTRRPAEKSPALLVLQPWPGHGAADGFASSFSPSHQRYPLSSRFLRE